jgi:molybdopterin-guanine dinucleotide biosynthesis protein A
VQHYFVLKLSKYSAIVLSGGESKRFGKDKGLFPVFQRPIISRIIEKVISIVDEMIIVTSTASKAEQYAAMFPDITILVDEYDLRGTIVGAVTGFRNASGDYSFLVPCDTPLISIKVLSLLKQFAQSYQAVIPKWPSGYIEPLQAIYKTQDAYLAAQTSIEEGKFTLRDMISRLSEVFYLPTQTIQQVDPNLLTFHNINTSSDLEKIKNLLK